MTRWEGVKKHRGLKCKAARPYTQQMAMLKFLTLTRCRQLLAPIGRDRDQNGTIAGVQRGCQRVSLKRHELDRACHLAPHPHARARKYTPDSRLAATRERTTLLL